MASYNVDQFGTRMWFNNVDNNAKNYQEQKRPDVYSSQARIEDILRVQRATLFHQAERLNAKVEACNKAVLERLKHSIQQDPIPPPQPPAASRQTPESSARKWWLNPIVRVPPCNVEVVGSMDTHPAESLTEIIPPAPPSSPKEEDGHTLQKQGENFNLDHHTAEEDLSLYPEIEEEWWRIVQDKKMRKKAKEERDRLADEEGRGLLPGGRHTKAESCYNTTEEDLSPFPEIEEEWRRLVRDKKMRKKAKEEKQRLADEERKELLSGGRSTHADFRYNMYIPLNSELPLPRPYGSQAPFRPYKPAASMRHFRKPTFKPIEI